MTTQTIRFTATDLVQEIANKKDGVPLGWLSSLFEKAKRQLGNNVAEVDTILVHGLEGVSFTAKHTLSQAEEQAQQIDQMSKMLNAIRSLLPREGTQLTQDQLESVRQALVVRVHA